MRVNHLGRTGMYEVAFHHILEKDPTFPYKKEDWERIQKTRKYDPSRGTTSPEFDKLCSKINNWLNDHYIMIEIDYTHEDDYGSRNEVVLCYERHKPGDDMFDSPDFEKAPELVCYR